MSRAAGTYAIFELHRETLWCACSKTKRKHGCEFHRLREGTKEFTMKRPDRRKRDLSTTD